MTEQTRTALKELQALDIRIEEARQKVRDFDPLFAEVEEPALVLEGEVGNTRKRLQEMKIEERKLELSTEEKRARVKRLEERLQGVRNLREEAAVSAELDMVRRALQSDEQDAYTLIDQIRKLDERLEELEGALKEAQALVDPRMKELVAERDQAKEALSALEGERERFVAGMDTKELRLYDSIRAGGRRRAVAELTHDGACGHCFGIVPLQIQNEVRHGTSLIRCEACGVILAAPADSEPEATGQE
jgi:predicted  nucleic acid-binding Zn-ribbon protein